MLPGEAVGKRFGGVDIANGDDELAPAIALRRYATLRLDDQVTFVHITQSERDPSPILEVKAFGEFQAGIRERCDEPPVAQAFTEVGSYRFLTG